MVSDSEVVRPSRPVPPPAFRVSTSSASLGLDKVASLPTIFASELYALRTCPTGLYLGCTSEQILLASYGREPHYIQTRRCQGRFTPMVKNSRVAARSSCRPVRRNRYPDMLHPSPASRFGLSTGHRLCLIFGLQLLSYPPSHVFKVKPSSLLPKQEYEIDIRWPQPDQIRCWISRFQKIALHLSMVPARRRTRKL